jgi:hypothetical protein
VERTSGYLMLVKMSDATATSAMKGFSAALNGMPQAMRKVNRGILTGKMNRDHQARISNAWHPMKGQNRT